MAEQIPLTGVAPDYRTPAAMAEILFAQGPASAAAGQREVVLVMPMTSAGTWTVNTLYGPIRNEKEVQDGGGPGSMLHRAARIFLQANKDAKLWCLPFAASSGGAPAAATGTAVFATTSTGSGTATVTICGEDCTIGITNGMTVTAMGDALVNVVNGRPWLPVTAGNSSGTVTLTARIVGASQGTSAIQVIRTRGSITSGIATTLTVSTHVGGVVQGADGTTTEAANFLTALGTIDANRKYYIVTNGNTSTYLGNLQTHITNKSEPKRGLRSVGIGAYVDTLAAAQTLATGRNYERLALICQPESDHDCAELAGLWAALRQKGEQVDSAKCFDFATSPLFKKAYNAADWPDGDDVSDAINDGVTVVVSHDNGAYVAMSVNTRSKNAAGTVDDFRATETHRVSVADEFVDETLLDWQLNHSGKKFADDERLSDGTINPVQRLRRGVITPSTFAPTIKKRMQDYSDAEKISDVEASKESVTCLKSTANSGRLSCQFDLRVIDHAHQSTFRVAEVSTG